MLDDLEFCSRLIKILTNEERERALKIAEADGFVVRGFSKDITRAPNSYIIKALQKKSKKGISQCIIIIHAITEIKSTSFEKSNKIDGEISPLTAAQLWIEKDEEKKERGLAILVEMEELRKTEAKEEAVSNISNIENFLEEKVLSNENLDYNNKEENVQLREKLKNLQHKIQGYKIQVGDYESKIQKLIKEIDKQQKTTDDLKEQYDELNKQNLILQYNISEKNAYIEELKEKIIYLEKYEQNAKKVLCFSRKDIINDEFPQYKITVIHDWQEKYKESIIWNDYDSVWIITKDFPYADVCIISSLCQCEVLKFFNTNKIKINGGN